MKFLLNLLACIFRYLVERPCRYLHRSGQILPRSTDWLQDNALYIKTKQITARKVSPYWKGGSPTQLEIRWEAFCQITIHQQKIGSSISFWFWRVMAAGLAYVLFNCFLSLLRSPLWRWRHINLFKTPQLLCYSGTLFFMMGNHPPGSSVWWFNAVYVCWIPV